LNDRWSVTFELPGQPVSWQRPGVNTKGARPSLYTPKPTKDHEGAIAGAFMRAARAYSPGVKDSTRQYGLDATFEIGRTPQRNDLDNLIKLVMDGLSGYAYKDDRQVVHFGSVDIIRNAEKPRTVIRVYEIG
jgi:crossover junction endodeoxyribonuclease RusA